MHGPTINLRVLAIHNIICLCITTLYFCAAQDILDYFRDSFIQCVDANTVIYDLEHANIISAGDLQEIKLNFNPIQQNQILHRCLKRSCDEKALKEVCEMMITVRGNRRMNALGRDVKCKLEGIIYYFVCSYHAIIIHNILYIYIYIVDVHVLFMLQLQCKCMHVCMRLM